MYVFLRNCYLRNLRSKELVRNHHFDFQIRNNTLTCYKKQQYRKCRSYVKPWLSSVATYPNPLLHNNELLDCSNNNNNPNLIVIRRISISYPRYDKVPLKPSSKVEVTVTALKDEKKHKDELAPTKKEVIVKKSFKERFLDEAKHYYHGFRLLFIDLKISCGLVWRILNGKTLSRREHNLLVRTVGDLFRLVPFSVFIVVPFLEFFLPLFIKFFPGMLPSTFQTSKDKEDKLKQNLKMKLEMAKFLQKTLDDMAVQSSSDRHSSSAKEFSKWFLQVRTSGDEVTNADIMRFSKLFQDEITLDSLSRGQLVALCRVLEVQTLGTNNLLRFQLRMKLRSLAADDKLIQKEGVDSLTVTELQNACKARGMRAYGLSEEQLRKQLNQWLDLSLNQKVPPSLLLLSRALMLPETIPTEDKLKATITSLPISIVTQTSAAIAEKEGKIDNKMKIEIIKEEARKVQEERKERREEQKRKEVEEKEVLVDKAPVIDANETVTCQDQDDLKKKKKQISTADLEVLEDALDALAKNKLILEKEDLKDLKEEMADYQEDVQELKEVTASESKQQIRETKAAKRLFNRVNKMILKMDTVVTELQNKEQKMKKDLAAGQSTVTQDDIVRIDELLGAIKKMQKVPDKSVLEQIENMLSKMDDDHDGSIKVEDVLKIIEVIGKEHVQLNAKQVDDIIELIDKEEVLEVEDKIEKALQKDAEKKATTKLQKLKKTSNDKNNNKDKEKSTKMDAQTPSPRISTPAPPTISIDQPKKGNSNSKML